jgi:hypothetical protein
VPCKYLSSGTSDRCKGLINYAADLQAAQGLRRFDLWRSSDREIGAKAPEAIKLP